MKQIWDYSINLNNGHIDRINILGEFMDMGKKTLILIIVCIVVFAFVALSYAGVFNHDETVTVSKVKFKLLEGYKAAGTTKQGYKK